MRAAVVIFGILGALVAGIAALLLLGDTLGILVAVLLFATAIAAIFVDRSVLKVLLGVVLVAFVGGLAVIGWLVALLVGIGSGGDVIPADPVALASAQAKIDAVDDAAAFRLELTEEEMTAYILDGLADNENNPLNAVILDVVDRPGEPGIVEFEADFQGSGADGSGSVSAELVNGEIKIELIDLGIGPFDVPGLAKGAIEDLIEEVGDLNKTLAENGANIQSIEIGNDRVIVTGTQVSTDLITSGTLLAGLQQSAASLGGVAPPPERLGPGVVNSTSAGAAPFYVALGDSLAANVGVDQDRDGYVSRLHNQLQLRDGQDYGLRNFGISGETTGTMIRAGQLDEAIAFMEDNAVEYVTIDIGANNLLGHLGSKDCSQTLEAPACAARLQSAFELYDDDIVLILDAIIEAAPSATVIFMRAYNPFSLGLGVGLEQASDQTLDSFNDLAASLAAERSILVADAFTPMMGTTGVTTHMLDATPDIHPLPIGFDILACSFLEALGDSCPV